MIKGWSLAGPHRTGKTTIAEAAAKELGITFVPTPVSDIFKKMGINPRDVLPYETRKKVQEEILYRCSSIWYKQNSHWITDRTPLDFICYFINDSMTIEDEHYESWLDYVDDCLEAQSLYFKHTFIVQPDGFIESGDEPFKGRSSRILQECMYYSFLGLANQYLYPSEYSIVDKFQSRKDKSSFVCSTIRG